MQGTVLEFNSAGYGTVVGDDTLQYYVHYTNLSFYPQRLSPGEKVSFTVCSDGLMAEAKDVKRLG